MSLRTVLALMLEAEAEKRGESLDSLARLMGYRSARTGDFYRLIRGRARIQSYEHAFAQLGLRISITLEKKDGK